MDSNEKNYIALVSQNTKEELLNPVFKDVIETKSEIHI